ncbi:MAG: PaaI family thioesterase [Microthrixaceae bacterium]
MTTDLIVMDAMALREFMEAAFTARLTWVIERVDDQGISIRQPVDDSNLRPGGTVSGPTLMTLADAVAYMAVLSRIGPEALAVTSNLNINFLRRPRPGDLVCNGRILKLGRTLALTEVEIFSASDPENAVAHSTVTYSMALLQPPN